MSSEWSFEGFSLLNSDLLWKLCILARPPFWSFVYVDHSNSEWTKYTHICTYTHQQSYNDFPDQVVLKPPPNTAVVIYTLLTDTDLQLLLNGLPELSHPGLHAVRELAVVAVKVPQKTGQRLCGTKRNWLVALSGHGRSKVKQTNIIDVVLRAS